MMLFRRWGAIARTVAAGLALAGWLSADPPLTTVQDVLFRADGSRFEGVVVITWNSFQASDGSNVTAQSLTVRIVDGNLRVRLVPNASAGPSALYNVKYNSEGKFQFEENWAVPASQVPVRVADVRVAVPPTLPGGQPGPPPLTTPVAESDVTGLVSDLSIRPVKGTAYALGRAVLVNAAGALDSVAGNATDCVHVDGSSGPCGSGGPGAGFVDGETPTGTVDGVNGLFTLSSSPNPPSSLAVYLNGILQKSGVDYTASTNLIQFQPGSIPQSGDLIMASYRLSGTGAIPASTPVQILCVGNGTAVAGTTSTSAGSCVIPAGTLVAGDRVAIRFDFTHEGAASGFTVEADWGGTVIARQVVGASESIVSGTAEAGLFNGGAQLSAQAWGAVTPFAIGIKPTTEPYGSGLTVDFRAKLALSSSDTVTLRSFSVVRYPKAP